MAIMDESKKLENEELKDVSGGYIFGDGSNASYNWEVIDDINGEVLGKYLTRDEARDAAVNQFNVSGDTIGWAKLNELRGL